jgi:hypothetical protein
MSSTRRLFRPRPCHRAPPAWYRIPEIPVEQFVKHIKPLYNVLEKKKTHVSAPDPFAQQGYTAFHGIGDSAWSDCYKDIQQYRAYTMAWGTFHQVLMGSFEGWTSVKGHPTKCDLIKNDGTAVVEVKNNINTMNSGGRASVMKNLRDQRQQGKEAMLVIVNGSTPNDCDADGVKTLDGRSFYAYLSGRPSFFDDVLKTTTACFERYKTHAALTASLFGR